MRNSKRHYCSFKTNTIWYRKRLPKIFVSCKSGIPRNKQILSTKSLRQHIYRRPKSITAILCIRKILRRDTTNRSLDSFNI